MNDSAFESWYNGMVGFHINSERILDDLMPVENPGIDPVKMRKWMVVCWNQALDAAMEYNAVDLEKLREKP
jgi:hypothetical protein